MMHTRPEPLLEPFASPAKEGHDLFGDKLSGLLRAVRTHLGMDVAFVSEFTEDHRIFRHVDSASPAPPIEVGGSDPLEESYCQWVVDGRLPELIPDTADVPAAWALRATKAIPVGAHLSVPIRFADGSVFGTFCCFSSEPDPSLNERDLSLLRMCGAIAAEQISSEIEAAKAMREEEARIRAVMNNLALRMVYQPIYETRHNQISGFECLARFDTQWVRSPDVWFDEAFRVGQGVHLEFKAIKLALQGLRQLRPDAYVTVNASPLTIMSDEFPSVLAGVPLERVVVEVTEHAAVLEYRGLSNAMEPLRAQGLRIAVDDAGAGHASFRHVLNLAPDIIKLDMSVTRSIDSDRSRRALAAALVGFATETNSKIVAEGVETASELSVIKELGIGFAQGYLLGKPMPVAHWTSTVPQSKAGVRSTGH